MNRVQRGLKELSLCERLQSTLDLTKPDYDLLPIIRKEAANLTLPTSEKFAAKILAKLKRRRQLICEGV